MDGPITEAEKLREERDALRTMLVDIGANAGVRFYVERILGERDAALERVAELEASGVRFDVVTTAPVDQLGPPLRRRYIQGGAPE